MPPFLGMNVNTPKGVRSALLVRIGGVSEDVPNVSVMAIVRFARKFDSVVNVRVVPKSV